MAYFVNVYAVDRQFGGNEEGGWWFDTGVIVKTLACATRKKAERCLAKVDLILKEANRDRPHPSSVLSRGDYLIASVDTKPGANYPEQTPHYE